jgi:hypothetical protein
MHLQFCKKILKVRNNTQHFTVYGELGRLPLEIMVEQKLVLFWNSMLFNNQKLSSIMYKLMLKLYEINPTKFKWISYTKSIMDDCDLSFMWNDQVPIDTFLLKATIRHPTLVFTNK